MDGFRVDVANLLVKDLSADLPSEAELAAMDRTSGTHPLMDRDEVHEIYAEWRKVFNEYTPPRCAVAEAWVETLERRAKYASSEGLGQAFSFDLLVADFDAGQFRQIITDNLEQVRLTGSTSTWVFSNHDVTRHATRYGLPPLNGRNVKQGVEWVKAGGPADKIDVDRGIRRAKAATMLMLALPAPPTCTRARSLACTRSRPSPLNSVRTPRSSAVPSMTDSAGMAAGSLPWEPDGTSFGFGTGGSHLPQPGWFARTP
ncbi:alpha,Alpha-Phosphotrehalase [Arthrobacter sp. Hiyo8]|nr:alpha,Alpha-Phosphotrehalase [Arthrobacter sp. Hiyo8]